MKKTIMLELDEIEKNPLNTYGLEDMESLKRSIKQNGIVTPITVIGPDTKGKFMLIAGKRRYIACCELAKETGKQYKLPAYVKGTIDTSELQQKLWMEVSNHETRKINENEYRAHVMNIFKEMVDIGEIGERQVGLKSAEYFGVSKRYGRYYRKVYLSDNEEIKNLVTQGMVSPQYGAEILKYTKEMQKIIITECKKRTKGKRGESVQSIIKKCETMKESIIKNEEMVSENEDQERIQYVIEWCNWIIQKEEVTEEELKAIEACKKVAAKYGK